MTDAASERRPEERPDATALATGLAFERVVFFSDAVFAIAATLLVIELRLPGLPADPTSGDVVTAIGAILPKIFAWVLSFATIGLYWLAHWRKFRVVARVDDRLAALNLVLLGLIAFIPFPTALIGDHGDLPVVVALYAASLSAAGIVGSLNWLYASRAGLIPADVDSSVVRSAALRGFAVPLVMLGSLVALPVIGPHGAELSWVLIFPVQLLVNRRLRPRPDATSVRSGRPQLGPDMKTRRPRRGARPAGEGSSTR
jgi:uncharacterized membrane protein